VPLSSLPSQIVFFVLMGASPLKAVSDRQRVSRFKASHSQLAVLSVCFPRVGCYLPVNKKRRTNMAKPLSEQLANLSIHAKKAEDTVAAAQKKTHDKIMARWEQARADPTATTS